MHVSADFEDFRLIFFADDILLLSERTGIWSRGYRGAEDELSAVRGGWAFKRELRYVILAKFGAVVRRRPCFLSQGLSPCLPPF